MTTMNRLTIQNTSIKHAGDTDIQISDYFIDGRSLQKTLKSKESYGTLFQYGRFKEFFLPILGNIDYGEYDYNEKGAGTIKVPNKNKEVITPLYGCHDNCCIYVFVKVCRKK